MIITTKACKFCKKQFECTSATPTKVFCSNDCLKAFYKEKHSTLILEKRNCQYCGKEFIWNNHKWGQKYCGKECANKAISDKWRRDVWAETKNCTYCGKEFEWFSNKPNQKYCSAECRQAATLIKTKNYNKSHNKRRKNADEQLRNEVYLKVLDIISKMDQSKGSTFGGRYIDYSVIGDISEKTREIVLERDRRECKVCKRKDSLHLHHLIKRKNGGNHNAENLITLCASCHRHIETGDIEHATNACFRNAKRYYGEKESNKTIDIDGLKAKLTLLFDKLKESPAAEDVEIMVCLDEALDLIDID